MTGLTTNQLWNLPAIGLPDRYDLFSKLIGDYLAGRFTTVNRAQFLEIGVWKASTLPNLVEDLGPIFNYVGVDPYGQLDDDYYRGPFGFWKTNREADKIYKQAKAEFDRLGATLIRETSQNFFAHNTQKFDVIFVDGDHRYNGCLYDCEASLKHIKPGGLLVIDDYGNSMHPEVEWAVREFYQKHKKRISRAGSHPLFFQLEGQIAPIMLAFICFEIN